MNLHKIVIAQPRKILSGLSGALDKAIAFAQSRDYDPNVFMNAKLAPDQFPLRRQVQSACDLAKFGVQRLVGREVPKHEDNEATIDELKARIASVLELLDSVDEGAVDVAIDAYVPLPFVEGKGLSVEDYIVTFLLPNFYFHSTSAYQILRHNGVQLGKLDFLVELPLRGPA